MCFFSSKLTSFSGRCHLITFVHNNSHWETFISGGLKTLVISVMEWTMLLYWPFSNEFFQPLKLDFQIYPSIFICACTWSFPIFSTYCCFCCSKCADLHHYLIFNRLQSYLVDVYSYLAFTSPSILPLSSPPFWGYLLLFLGIFLN